jgi:hypothetical protein
LNCAIRTPAGHALGQSPFEGRDALALEVDHPFLEMTVVVALEQDDHLATVDRPGQPDRLGVGLGGGQRELPHRNG